jgi:hypothetical protein
MNLSYVLPDGREDLECLVQYSIGLRPAGYAPTRPQPLRRREDAGRRPESGQPRTPTRPSSFYNFVLSRQTLLE